MKATWNESSILSDYGRLPTAQDNLTDIVVLQGVYSTVKQTNWDQSHLDKVDGVLGSSGYIISHHKIPLHLLGRYNYNLLWFGGKEDLLNLF